MERWEKWDKWNRIGEKTGDRRYLDKFKSLQGDMKSLYNFLK